MCAEALLRCLPGLAVFRDATLTALCSPLAHGAPGVGTDSRCRAQALYLASIRQSVGAWSGWWAVGCGFRSKG